MPCKYIWFGIKSGIVKISLRIDLESRIDFNIRISLKVLLNAEPI